MYRPKYQTKNVTYREKMALCEEVRSETRGWGGVRFQNGNFFTAPIGGDLEKVNKIYKTKKIVIEKVILPKFQNFSAPFATGLVYLLTSRGRAFQI